MKKSILLIVVALGLGVRAFAAEGVTSFNFTDPTNAFSGIIPGGAGFEFKPTSPMTITSLGFAGDLSEQPYFVSLRDVNGFNLASALVTLGSPLINQTRYGGIESVVLNVGDTYFVEAHGSFSGEWAGSILIAPPNDLANGTFTTAPDFTYVGAAYGTNGSGVFPLSPGSSNPNQLYVGANFLFNGVPEPSTIALVGTAVALAPWVRRRFGRRC